MVLLIASVLALVVGPVLVRLTGRRPGPVAFLDGFVMVALLGLIVLLVLPDALAHGGGWVALAAAVGLVLPPLLEHRLGSMHDAAHGAMLWSAMAGLAVHAMLDGAVLTGDHGHAAHGGSMLALGVLLHRVPLGLTIWWAVRPNRGRKAAFAILALISVATVVGYVGAAPLMGALPLKALAFFQALVAGSLLHVVFGHQPQRLRTLTTSHRFAATAGAVVAAASLVLLLEDEHHAVGVAMTAGAGRTFLMLALESAPALLLAFAGAGLLRAWLSPASVRWLGDGGSASQAAKGMVFGLPMPICSCGVLPVYRSLVVSGVPATAAMAFLIATPEIGLDAILITVPLMGTELAVVRLVAAAIVALAVGWALGARVSLSHAAAPPEPAKGTPAARSLGTRFADGLRFGFGELVDHIGPWIVVGLALAALIEPLLSEEWLTKLPQALEVPLMAVVGLPGYVCASGATPLAAVLMHNGLSAGAAVAFLLTGPATNITTFAVLSALHGRKVALAFAAAVGGLAIGLGWLVNGWLQPTVTIPLGEAGHDSASWLNVFCLGILSVVMFASLLRQGPRGVLAQLFDPQEEENGHDHGHAHDHAHGHDHDHPRDELDPAELPL